MTKREMTIEEAIKIFKEVREELIAKETELSKQVFENLGIKAVDLAIKVLEQQPCEDCISREALLDKFEEPMNWTDSEAELQEQRDYEGFIELVKSMPSITPTRPKGKWSRPSVVAMPYSFAYECPICRQWGNIQTFKPNYCPNCGADMRGETE